MNRRRRSTAALARLIGGLALFVLGLVVLGASPARTASMSPQAYVVIVHPQRPEAQLDRRFLSRALLKKATVWGDGETIRPVDQASDSPTRHRFSEEILGRSVSAVRNYWQQLIFAGRGVPPPELESDEAVVRYVQRHPGALGYVSGTANVGNARVIEVR